MRRKKENWFVTIYNENKLYVWVIVGVLILSGVSIGMAMGKNKSSNVKILENNGDYSYNKEVTTQTNVIPTKENINTYIDTNNYEKENEKKNEHISNEDNNEPIKEVKVEKQLQFIMPVDGEIFKDFSNNTLMYSNTLEQWINHTGIDILSEKATPVKCIEDGTVTDIKQDPRYGYTIIIDHGQGYNSIYCNLSTLDMVYLNKQVERGQVISGVGDTALFESKDKSHLHFELMKDNAYVNPADYIKGE